MRNLFVLWVGYGKVNFEAVGYPSEMPSELVG